jgi:hypothetical protein
MTKITLDQVVKFGDTVVDSITVKPLYFTELVALWQAASDKPKPEAALQRLRMIKQVEYKSVDQVFTPEYEQVGQLPIAVAKAIIAALEVGQGVMGKLVSEGGDGTTTPIVYKLGTPIEMKGADGKSKAISELEFMAKTYSEVEDVLAADTELGRALALIRDVATPLGVDGLMRLPGWALDRFTVADGLGIMRSVSPVF